MQSNQESIDRATLGKLIDAGAVRGAAVVGQPGGWCVFFRYGMHERVLALRRSGEPRRFRKLETLVEFLRELHITAFQIDASGWEPTEPAVRRPDRAAALRRVHAAARQAGNADDPDSNNAIVKKSIHVRKQRA